MPADFTRLPYANPDAPKGGRSSQACSAPSTASIRSSSKGLAVQPVRGYVVESLMARGYDEPFTLYGLLAQSVETDDARTYVTFTLDPAAHFSDGVAGHRGRRRLLLAAVARSRAGRTTAPTTPKWKKPRSSAERAVRFDLSAMPTTANCR